MGKKIFFFSFNKMDIKKKIMFFTLIPFLIILIVISVLTIQNKNNAEQNLVTNRIESFVSLLETGELSYEVMNDLSTIESVFDEKIVVAELVGVTGETLYSTVGDLPLELVPDSGYIQKAREGKKITLNNVIDGREIIEVYYPLFNGKKLIGVLHTGLLYERSSERVKNYAYYIVSICLASMLVVFVLISLLSDRIISRKIKNLTTASQKIADGQLDFELKYDMETNDEIEKLSQSFEIMRETLISMKSMYLQKSTEEKRKKK